MVEFFVVCLALVPMFFMVVYIAKYFDMKQAAHQASRYAAFERSWDPEGHIKSDDAIQKEIQRHFFSTQREVGQQQAALSDNDHIPLWNDLRSKRMLNNFSDVTLTLDRSGTMPNGFDRRSLDNPMTGRHFRLQEPNTVKAMVNVKVSNIAHYAPLSDINLTLPAATAIGAGSWSASGAKDEPGSVCGTVAGLVLPAQEGGVGDAIRSAVSSVMSIFEDSELELGIIQPDLVPEGSLKDAGALPAWQNVPVTQQNGNKC
ncbi:MAG: hypothetical protein LBP52_04575 [Burkholderiaceae bacterium]|nr:hypothetical protein [Burkholderiaceae bacterium]